MKASVLNFAIVIYYWFYLLLTVHISWELHGVLYGFGNSFAVIMVYKWYTNVVFYISFHWNVIYLLRNLNEFTMKQTKLTN